MIHTMLLLILYILSVTVLLITARLKPESLYRLHPILLLGLYSFIPAINLGLHMLRSKFWMVFEAMPLYFFILLIGLAGLILIMIIPARQLIHQNTLDLSSKAAREYLEILPKKMMAIEAQLSLGQLDQGRADQAKAQIQRQVDRLAANDGLGRLLYVLLKLHLLRLTLQIAGAIAINLWSADTSLLQTLTMTSSILITDSLLIFLPYLLLLSVIALLTRHS